MVSHPEETHGPRLRVTFRNTGPGDPSAFWRIDGSAYAMSDDFVAALPSEH
jgi:hypothetical protein